MVRRFCAPGSFSGSLLFLGRLSVFCLSLSDVVWISGGCGDQIFSSGGSAAFGLGGLWGSGHCWFQVCGVSGFVVLRVGLCLREDDVSHKFHALELTKFRSARGSPSSFGLDACSWYGGAEASA